MIDDDFIARVGTFFTLVGVGLMILFSASVIPLFDSKSQDFQTPTKFDYLFWAVVLLGLGALMRRKAAPPPPSGRFSGIRNFIERHKKQDKKNQKK